MDKKKFNDITKEIFKSYGFIKKREIYLLILDDITIECRLLSSLGLKSFYYAISINALYDNSITYEKRNGVYIYTKMEHTPSAEGYHKSEIKYEDYTEDQYRELLTNMLHNYFDPYKQDALKYVKDNYKLLTLKPDGIAFLGINTCDK